MHNFYWSFWTWHTFLMTFKNHLLRVPSITEALSDIVRHSELFIIITRWPWSKFWQFVWTLPTTTKLKIQSRCPETGFKSDNLFSKNLSYIFPFSLELHQKFGPEIEQKEMARKFVCQSVSEVFKNWSGKMVKKHWHFQMDISTLGETYFFLNNSKNYFPFFLDVSF